MFTPDRRMSTPITRSLEPEPGQSIRNLLPIKTGPMFRSDPPPVFRSDSDQDVRPRCELLPKKTGPMFRSDPPPVFHPADPEVELPGPVPDSLILVSAASSTVPAWYIRPGQPIVKEEHYNADVMDALLRDTKSFSAVDLKRLGAYKKGRTHGSNHAVQYEFARGCEKEAWGRLYVKDNKGLQSFPFDMRNPLLERDYWDCDMENCHFWIFLHIGERLKVSTSAIRRYCEHRDEELARVSPDKRTAKTAFLKVGYGGSIGDMNDDWNARFTDDDLDPTGDLTLLHRIEAEIAVIRQKIWDRNPALKLFVKEKEKSNEFRICDLRTDRGM